MSEILLLNPRRKRRRMPAGLARYWRTHRRRASNPRRRRRRHARRANPIRRRRRLRAMSHRRRSHRRVYRMNRRRRRRSNPRRRYARRRNPRSEGIARDIIGGYVVPGTIGAVGAIGFDVLWGYLSPNLPANLQGSGWVQTFAELIALWGSVKIIDSASPGMRRKTHAAALGAATVIAYNALKGVAAQVLPAGTPGLSGYIPAARYSMSGLGAYQVRRLAGLNDIYSPAAIVQSPIPRQFGAYQAHQMGGLGEMSCPDVGGQ